MYLAYAPTRDGKKIETRMWKTDPKAFAVMETLSVEEHEYEHHGREERVFRDHEALPIIYADVMLLAQDKPDIVDPAGYLWLRFLEERAATARKHGRTYAQTVWHMKARDDGEWPDDWLSDGAIAELAEVAVGSAWRATNEKEERLMEYEVANGASNHWRFLKAQGRKRC